MTTGLGIIATFALSAMAGLLYPLPAAIMIGVVMALGTLLAYLFLKEIEGIPSFPTRHFS